LKQNLQEQMLKTGKEKNKNTIIQYFDTKQSSKCRHY
jgi:hypothetical protein